MSFKDELVSKSRTANDKRADDIAKWMEDNVGMDALTDNVKEFLMNVASGGKTYANVMLLSWAVSTADFSHVGHAYDAVLIPYSACNKVSARAMTSYMDNVVAHINRSLGLNGRLMSNSHMTVMEYTYSVDWGE